MENLHEDESIQQREIKTGSRKKAFDIIYSKHERVTFRVKLQIQDTHAYFKPRELEWEGLDYVTTTQKRNGESHVFLHLHQTLNLLELAMHQE